MYFKFDQHLFMMDAEQTEAPWAAGRVWKARLLTAYSKTQKTVTTFIQQSTSFSWNNEKKNQTSYPSQEGRSKNGKGGVTDTAVAVDTSIVAAKGGMPLLSLPPSVERTVPTPQLPEEQEQEGPLQSWDLVVLEEFTPTSLTSVNPSTIITQHPTALTAT